MGKIEISGTGLPGGTAVRLDGQDIARGLRGLTFTLGADRVPVVELDVAAFELDLEGVHIHIPDATRELLVRLGWIPPEGSVKERGAIVELIRGYFAATDDPLYEDVRILCGRIERGEHMPAKGV